MNKFLLAPILICSLFATTLQAQVVQNPELRARVEASVNRGLDYLSDTLTEQGFYEKNLGNTTAVTALAGMAFLSAGHIPGKGQYGETIYRLIDYILNNAEPIQMGPMKNAAYFGRKGNGRMYAHSIATLFLSEISGMVDPERQTKLDAILPDAVRLILDAQAVKKPDAMAGGWRYEPTSQDSDMSCSGWALMALRSARLNGAPVPDEAIDRAVQYVKRNQNPQTGFFGYQNASSNPNTLTGAGILCLELCGRHNDEASQKAVGYLKTNYQSLQNNPRAFYGLYYTSQGLFQMGGEVWKTFESWMYDTWIPQQKPDGFWDRKEENCIPYQTAMCILAFTVPYRQLPIYQRDETVDE